MSFNYEEVRNKYIGDNATSVFAYEFHALKESHLRVIVYDSENNETVLALGTDYIVEGVGHKNGGAITLLDNGGAWLYSGTENLSSDYEILILLKPEINQSTDIRNNGDFYPEVHEDTFDYSRHIDLMLSDVLNRAVKTKESVNKELILPKFVEGQVLAWDSMGELVNLILSAVATSNDYNDLDNRPNIPSLAPVQSVAGKTGVVLLTKNDVSGLENVDNTSDAQKAANGPIKDLVDNLRLRDLSDVDNSGFTQLAVVTYNPATGHFEAGASGGGGAVDSVNGHIGVVVLSKSDIGLGNVDNTSDASKPISTAQQAALDNKANVSSLATVATTGSFNDLTNAPTVPENFSQLFAKLGQRMIFGGSISSTDQVLNFRGTDHIIVPDADANMQGRILFLSATAIIGGHPVEIRDTSGNVIGTWDATAASFGLLICEEYDFLSYRWRIVDLAGSGQANISTHNFTGDGSTTSFDTGVTISGESNVIVMLDNTTDQTGAFTVSGSSIFFDEAPLNGVPITVRIFGSVDIGVPSDDTVSTSTIQDGAVTRAKLSDDSSIKYLTKTLSADLTSNQTNIADLNFSGIPPGSVFQVLFNGALEANSGRASILIREGVSGNYLGEYRIKSTVPGVSDETVQSEVSVLTEPFAMGAGGEIIVELVEFSTGDVLQAGAKMTVFVYPDGYFLEDPSLS